MEEEQEEEVLEVVWKDWRPNVQIAPINRTRGWGGLQLCKVFVQCRVFWMVGVGHVSRRHYATSLNHLRSWAQTTSEDLRVARTSLTRYVHQRRAGGILLWPRHYLHTRTFLFLSRSTNVVELNVSSLSLCPPLRSTLNFYTLFPLLSLLWSSMLRYAVTFCLLALTLAQDCQVQNIQVKENFDRHRVSSRTRHPVRILLKVIRQSAFLWVVQILVGNEHSL